MEKIHKSLVIIVYAIFFVALSFGSALSADEVTISGTVNDNYEIETDDGEIYEIGDSEQGDELVGYVGSRVEVTGTIEEDEDGVKVITITSFVLLEEASEEDIEIIE
ncbi:MAG: hypothetical protein JW896_06495 [Deltaproteobacteria bacterium]|nr:hypothetical protein [Deltaproteobacteria bacterium]